MMGGFGPSTSLAAARPAAALAAVLCCTAAGAQSHACDFTQECLGTDPCSGEVSFVATLQPDGAGWQFITMDDEVIPFEALEGGSEGTLRLLSRNFDGDAGAVSLLTLVPGGRVFLSTHGFFPEPAVVTHLGTCTRGER